jgi:uncharacterized cupredoxin-like copper-binding protein
MRALTHIVAAAVILAAPAARGHGPAHSHGAHHSGHDRAIFGAGEPGDPRKPSRIVRVVMREAEDGRMLFAPDTLAFRKGEQVRFVLRNAGKIEHEFLLDTPAGNAVHKAEMAKNPSMRHDDPNGARVEASKTAELIWRFSKAGTYEFACLIPGHYEAGMRGTITVK